MISMEIIFDDKKIKKNSEYNLSQVTNRLYDVLNKNGIDKKNNKGLYVGNDDDKDLGRFICVIGDLRDEKWFFPYLKKWVTFE